MYKEITIPLVTLYDILKSKRSRELYLKLLEEHIVQDDKDSNINFVVIDNYEKNKKKYGYKTRSGLWKAIAQLEYIQAIDIGDDNRIYLRGCKLVLQRPI